MKRRDFVIALGAGSGASIAGFFLWKSLSHAGARPRDSAASVDLKPQLKAGLLFGTLDGFQTIRLPEGEGSAMCALNDTGAAVIRLLDGRNGVEEVSQTIARTYGLVRTDSLDARIAYFLTQVSRLGFLKSPFYAYIVDVPIA
jgi:hypothetical protein